MVDEADDVGPGQLVALAGSPPGLGKVYRLPGDAVPDLSRFTVTYYGQHLHFERTTQVETVEGQDLPVFQWTYSTAIAE